MVTNKDVFPNSNDFEGIVESITLTEREKQVWDKGWADGQEYMRQVHVQNGYAARGMRVPGMSPSAKELGKFLKQAGVRLGSVSKEETKVYIDAFWNACLAGYPPLFS